ncbi:cupin domain-containing protein [Mycolicibacterium phlei]
MSGYLIGGLLGAAGAVVAIGVAPAALATPPAGDVERTDIAKGTSDAPIAIVTDGQPTTLYVQNLVLGPHATSGWHTHPGPEHSVVTDGALKVQLADACAPAVIGSGQAVFIPAGVPHVVFTDGADHASATVTYTLPAELPVRDDAPAACP